MGDPQRSAAGGSPVARRGRRRRIPGGGTAAKGLPVDLDLVRAGALLHDLAKGGPRHAERGAELLRALDLPEVAAIVANHMEPESKSLRIDESALVFFADKLVRGEAFVGLDKRFCPAIERFEGDPEALAAALRRKAMAKALQRQIEAVLGAAIDGAFLDPARILVHGDALAHELLSS
ncbi:MAG: HD domain-containing protein [Terracidiphilus sp.]